MKNILLLTAKPRTGKSTTRSHIMAVESLINKLKDKFPTEEEDNLHLDI